MEIPLGPLRNLPYLKLLASNVITTLGFWFTYVAAFDIFVFQTDVGPLAIGILGMSAVAPMVIGGPIAGVIADQYERRRVIIATYLLCVPFILLLVFYRSIILAYAVFFITGFLYSIARPAYRALIPQLVPDEQLEEANGLLASSDSAAQILGPGIAGTLLVVVDARTLFILDATSYVLAAILVFIIPVTVVEPSDDAVLSGFRNGVNYMRQTPLLLMLTSLGVVLFVAAGVFEAIVPYYIRELLGQGSSTYSMFLLATGVGSFIGGISFGVVNNHIRSELLPSVSLLLFSIAIGTFVFVRVESILTVASVGIGLAMVWFMSAAYTSMHRRVNEEYQGRIFGIFQSSVRGAQVIAMSAAGIVVSVVGTVELFGVVTGMLLLGCVVWVLFAARTSDEWAASQSTSQ